MSNEQDDRQNWRVRFNDDNQYAVWPDDRPLPVGWYQQDYGAMTKAAALEYIAHATDDQPPVDLSPEMEAEDKGWEQFGEEGGDEGTRMRKGV